MVIWIREENGNAGECRRMGGMLEEVVLPAEGLFWRYRRRRLWKKLRCRRFCTFAVPRELEAEALAWGIRPVKAAALRRALLPRLYEKGCIVSADAAALRAPDATAEVYQAAAFLAERSRYLSLELEHDGEQVSAWLRQQYGISAGRFAGKVCGGVTFCGAPRCGEIHLGEDCGRYQQVRYAVDGGELPEELAAALWSAGLIPAEEIRVLSVRTVLDTTGESRYNTMI